MKLAMLILEARPASLRVQPSQLSRYRDPSSNAAGGQGTSTRYVSRPRPSTPEMKMEMLFLVVTPASRQVQSSPVLEVHRHEL